MHDRSRMDRRMAKKKPQADSRAGDRRERPIAENRKARHRFDVLDTLECGVALAGSEVKSLRNGKVSLEEAYGRVRANEFWLVGCDIPEYPQATIWNHEPKRPRKLLVHRSELRKFAGRAHEKGLTLVPLKLYFNEARDRQGADGTVPRQETARQTGSDEEDRCAPRPAASHAKPIAGCPAPNHCGGDCVERAPRRSRSCGNCGVFLPKAWTMNAGSCPQVARHVTT